MTPPFEILPPFVSPDEILRTIQTVAAMPDSDEKKGLLKTLNEALTYAMHPPVLVSDGPVPERIRPGDMIRVAQ